MPFPRVLHIAEALLIEPVPAAARVGFREQLEAEHPIWERYAERAAPPAPAAFGKDEPPPWWEPDSVIAARQAAMLAGPAHAQRQEA